ncbi:hypothetical protein [Streptomyces sp. NPDC002573]|uniref:hypothetical protein n=1 Tax=Streptomyces sp. NPDC002573 TaxID=3364651 RepID=UPI0036C8B3AF
MGAQAMEYRDELMEAAAVLDALALCRPPGGHLSGFHVEGPTARPDKGMSCASTPLSSSPRLSPSSAIWRRMTGATT